MKAFIPEEEIVTIKLNIGSRKSNESISKLKLADTSSKFYTHNFNNKEEHHTENDVNENFTILNLDQEVEELKKEVLKSPKKKQRRFILTTISTVLMLQRIVSSSMLGSPMTAFATSEAIPVNATATGTESTLEIIKVLLETLETIVPQIRNIAIVLATLLLILVGVLQMLRRKELIAGWTDDIIKGLVQILIAPTLVALIYYATAVLLGDSSTFSTLLP